MQREGKEKKDMEKLLAWIKANMKEGVKVEDAEELAKALIKGAAKPTVEGVKEFLETDEGKKFLQPILDGNFTKGLDTWKKNNLEKEVQKLYDEKHPPETETDKKLLELQKKLDERDENDRRRDAELAREKRKTNIISLATKDKVGLSFTDDDGKVHDITDLLIGEDDDVTSANYAAFKGLISHHSKAIKEGLLNNHGIKHVEQGDPPAGNLADLKKQLGEAEKSGNMQAQIKLSRQISSLQKKK